MAVILEPWEVDGCASCKTSKQGEINVTIEICKGSLQ